MQRYYCENCEQVTGHKRVIGAGTLIAALLTGGLSLAALPWYPLRCVLCGSTEPWPLSFTYLVMACAFGLLSLLSLLILLSRVW